MRHSYQQKKHHILVVVLDLRIFCVLGDNCGKSKNRVDIAHVGRPDDEADLVPFQGDCYAFVQCRSRRVGGNCVMIHGVADGIRVLVNA